VEKESTQMMYESLPRTSKCVRSITQAGSRAQAEQGFCGPPSAFAFRFGGHVVMRLVELARPSIHMDERKLSALRRDCRSVQTGRDCASVRTSKAERIGVGASLMMKETRKEF
jgi:hypothetical protein